MYRLGVRLAAKLSTSLDSPRPAVDIQADAVDKVARVAEQKYRGVSYFLDETKALQGDVPPRIFPRVGGYQPIHALRARDRPRCDDVGGHPLWAVFE